MSNVIKVTTIHESEGEKYPMNISTKGGYRKINDKHYITYDYVDAEGGGISKMLVEVTNSKVVVTAKGDGNYQMIFEAGKTNVSNTTMNGMAFSFKQVTDRADIYESDEQIKVVLDYALYQNEILATKCHMEIVVIK